MKRLHIILLATIVALVSCSKMDIGYSDSNDVSGAPIQFNIKVADFSHLTKGVSDSDTKTSWEAGDVIRLWFSMPESQEGGFSSDAILEYLPESKTWTVLAYKPNLVFESSCDNVYALYVQNYLNTGTNDYVHWGWSYSPINGWSTNRFAHLVDSQHHFDKWDLCADAFDLYYYDNGVVDLDLKFSLVTKYKVLISGLDVDHAENYFLSCNGLNPLSDIIFDVNGPIYYTGESTGPIDVLDRGAIGVPDKSGKVAFYFTGSNANFDNSTDYRFTLYECQCTDNGIIPVFTPLSCKTYTAASKTLTDEDCLTVIKLSSSDFRNGFGMGFTIWSPFYNFPQEGW